MTKNVCLALFFLFISYNSFSQKVGFGIKAGGNVAKLRDISTNSESGTSFKRGAHFGLFSDFRLAKSFALQPEIVYSTQGFRDESRAGKTTSHLNYLNIPVMAKIYFGKSFYLQTGPQLGILLSARQEGNYSQVAVDEDVKIRYKATDLGLCIGLGADILKRFSVSGQYNLGLTNVHKETSYRLSNRVFQFSLGLKLGKVNKETGVEI